MLNSTPPKSVSFHVGSQNWQNCTIHDLKLSQALSHRSNRNCDISQSQDFGPNARELLADLSNNLAHKYFREVRLVTAHLQESVLDTNVEIRNLLKVKNELEKGIENRRKNLCVNKESIEYRCARPTREKEHDSADDLLNAERQHLRHLKRVIEGYLKSVKDQLSALDSARARLNRCLRERSRVLDLTMRAMTAGTFGRTTPMPWPQTRPHSTEGIRVSGRNGSRNGFTVDPLGPYTPEAEGALREAHAARVDSQKLRSDLVDAIAKSDQVRKAADVAVNFGLQRKVQETSKLKQQLILSGGQNRNAMHRAHRLFDATIVAQGYQSGPISSDDLTCREKLTRPIIATCHRHPGTQLPEAQDVINHDAELDLTLRTTGQSIDLLHMAQARVQANARAKQLALDVDNSVLRMRRRKADNRWIMGEA